MSFMDDNIFLENEKAKELYAFCKDMPIFDYHCHLSPKEIYENKTYYNLTELWLEADHYKWRVMRAAGIDEKYITGDGDAKTKFEMFCKALPLFIGNPVYHWAHLELKKYFGITLPLCPENADTIWEETTKKMSKGGFSAQNLIEKSNVKCVITTDDPIDSLEWHDKIKNLGLNFEVLPCFRPDKVINIDDAAFTAYVKDLSKASNITIDGIDSLTAAIKNRLEFFISKGVVSADISFLDFPEKVGDAHIACLALKKALKNKKITKEESEAYRFEILKRIAKLLQENNIVMQLHIGVIRNGSTILFEKIGRDVGGDSVANPINILNAQKLLDAINLDGGLPKTIIYTLNPVAYYPIATLLGSFQGASKGRMQLGAAWWFADHKEGIKEQLKMTVATGSLGVFNGMLTDSRSFTSYARHDYFRRILCSYIGDLVEKGEYPDDEKALKKLVEDISYNNAKEYFRR